MQKMKLVFATMLVTLVLAVGFSCKQNAGGSHQKEMKEYKFLKSDHWNQGKAEYQLYNLTVGWYGHPRKSEDSLMVLVKEPWDLDNNVKVPAKKMNAAVLKYSVMDQFKTGTYNYSFKSDFFIDMDNGRVVKWTLTSQDGCGTHMGRYDRKGNTGIFTWHSYWNGHGIITKTVNTSSFDTFHDALPAYLRFRLDEKSYKIKMIQSLTGNHPPGTKKLDKKGIEAMSYPAIKEASVSNSAEGDMVKTEVKIGDKTEVYYFSKDMPHTLQKTEGVKFGKELRFSKFFPYWTPENRSKEAGWLLNQ